MKKISNRDLRQLEALNTASVISKKEALLAIDYGEKFCGLSWSPDGAVVFPVLVIERELALQKIKLFVQEKMIQKIIIGLPLGSRNEENHICRQIRDFAKNLQNLVQTIYFQNELFSSQIVWEGSKRIDDLAAAKILEYWLERK